MPDGFWATRGQIYDSPGSNPVRIFKKAELLPLRLAESHESAIGRPAITASSEKITTSLGMIWWVALTIHRHRSFRTATGRVSGVVNQPTTSAGAIDRYL
jgi:hypothetical protein